MKRIIEKHKKYWLHKPFYISVIVAFLLLIFSIVVNYYALAYANEKQSNFVTDIILDNIPTFNVGFIFTWGAILLMAFVALLLALEPKRIPFVVKSSALFVFIRSVFITLTHLAPVPDHSAFGVNQFLSMLSLDGSADLFFSGHTGFPFLMALIFWDNKKLRITFIAISIVLASAVLLGHLHYSIDVFAAYFITYTIFHIATKFFKKDYSMFHHGIKKTN